MRHALALLGCSAALLGRHVVAQPLSGPELSWDAPAGCPQAAEVRARIEAIAGAAVQKETHLQARARVTRAEGRFHLRLWLRDGELTGERNITADSCEDLAGATAVALGLMLRSETPLTERALRGARDTAGGDASASQAEPVPSVPPAPAAPLAVEPQASEAAPPQRSRSAARPVRALVRAPALVGELGALPEPSAGFGLGVGAHYDDWLFVLSGQFWLPQTLHGTAFPGHGARVARQLASLTMGRAFRAGRAEVGPCLTLALQRISARGTGAGVTPSEARAVWLGVGAGAQGALEVAEALAIFADVGARVETARPLLAIDGLGDVAQIGPVTLAAAVGLQWSF